MNTITQLETALVSHIGKLYQDFLHPFIPTQPEHTDADFGNPVKAYCVLSHAAFEEFIEDVSLLLMKVSVDGWLMRRHCGDVLLMSISVYGISVEIGKDDRRIQDRCFDVIRGALERVKEAHSIAIHNNHGFSVKYLRAALTPVFVDVPNDPVLLASLSTLADARGSFAHKSSPDAHYVERNGRARRPVAPEQARDIIHDCLELCRRIATTARLLVPEKNR